MTSNVKNVSVRMTLARWESQNYVFCLLDPSMRCVWRATTTTPFVISIVTRTSIRKQFATESKLSLSSFVLLRRRNGSTLLPGNGGRCRRILPVLGRARAPFSSWLRSSSGRKSGRRTRHPVWIYQFPGKPPRRARECTSRDGQHRLSLHHRSFLRGGRQQQEKDADSEEINWQADADKQ